MSAAARRCPAQADRAALSSLTHAADITGSAANVA
jgi:hypothetical protein